MIKKIKNLKRRSKDISESMMTSDGGYNIIHIDDTYILATGDYQVEEMEDAPLSSLKPPLWDWLNIFNKKTKKVWYIDFSCPYTHENFSNLTEKEKINLAVIDLFYKYNYDNMKIHNPFFTLSNINSKQENDHYEMTKDYYKKYNNWDLTFDSYEKIVEENKQWDEDIVVLHKERQDFGVIMPHSYLKKDDMTVKDIFKKVIMIIKTGKVKPKHENKKYLKLIDEINFELNLFNKEKDIERFI
jgi:hypothetical protein